MKIKTTLAIASLHSSKSQHISPPRQRSAQASSGAPDPGTGNGFDGGRAPAAVTGRRLLAGSLAPSLWSGAASYGECDDAFPSAAAEDGATPSS